MYVARVHTPNRVLAAAAAAVVASGLVQIRRARALKLGGGRRALGLNASHASVVP